MDITEVGAFDEEGVRYFPNFDGAHGRIARRRELESMPDHDDDEARELAEIIRWQETEALYVEMEPISSEDYQKAKAKSPHLRKSLQIQQGKKGPSIDGTGLESRLDAFVEDLLRSRIKRVGNCRARIGKTQWRAIETIDDLLATLKRSDRETQELIEDLHRALISISHLEAGLGN